MMHLYRASAEKPDQTVTDDVNFSRIILWTCEHRNVYILYMQSRLLIKYKQKDKHIN